MESGAAMKGRSSSRPKTAMRIEYCTSWGYLARAAGLAENLLHEYHDQIAGGVTLVPGETGSFEVFLNRKKIFSKLKDDRFPEANEVEEKVGQLLNG
jgi:selenoprotein W-related protein